MHPNAILREVQQLYKVSDHLDVLSEHISSSQKHSSLSPEAFATGEGLAPPRSNRKITFSPGFVGWNLLVHDTL